MDKKFQVALPQVANDYQGYEHSIISEGERKYVDRWIAKTMSDEKTRVRSATQNQERLKKKIANLRLREYVI